MRKRLLALLASLVLAAVALVGTASPAHAATYQLARQHSTPHGTVTVTFTATYTKSSTYTTVNMTSICVSGPSGAFNNPRFLDTQMRVFKVSSGATIYNSGYIDSNNACIIRYPNRQISGLAAVRWDYHINIRLWADIITSHYRQL